jgi:hypothetical protein
VTLPKLVEYPPELEWKTVDVSLASRILSFRSEIVLADRSVAFWWEVDPELVRTECDSQMGKCGYRAWQLASDLRARYKLPPLNIAEHSWDPTKILSDLHDRAIRQLRENQKTPPDARHPILVSACIEARDELQWAS